MVQKALPLLPGRDAFTIARLLGHSDVRVTMRYVRTVERVNVRLLTLWVESQKNVHVLATRPKQPQLPVAVKG
jgi:integrase